MQRPRHLATLLSIVLSLSLAALAQQGLPEEPKAQSGAQQAFPDSHSGNHPQQLPTAPVSPSTQTQQMTGDASSGDTQKRPRLKPKKRVP